MSEQNQTHPNSEEADSGDNAIISFRVPKDVKTDFRVACIKSGKTMNDTLLTLVEGFIKAQTATLKTLSIILAITLFAPSGMAQMNPLFEDLLSEDSTPATSESTTPQPMDTGAAPVIPTPEPIPPAPAPSEPTPAPIAVPATPVPTPSPVKAQQVKPVDLVADGNIVRVDIEQMELGPISRTISESDLEKMNVELIVTDKVKPMSVKMGDQQVTLEVPVVGYLIKEVSVTPSPLAVPVASPDFGYRFSDNDMRDMKIHYNAILQKANSNPTTLQRFQEVLKDMENYIRSLDARKAAASEVSIN